MAGAYSSHMLSKFEESTVPPPSICTSGLMSFDQSMHGVNMFSTQQSMALGPSASQASNMSGMSAAAFSDYMFERVNRLQAKLNQKLGPEYISQRPGPGGGAKLTYAEGWKVINVANEVFGYEGWSSSIVNMTTDYMDYNEETRRYNVGVSVILRVTLKEGVSHEDVGYGMIENAKSKGMALDKVKKEAVTDALKRTLRTFGNVLGNCLYDKQYTAEVVKIKVPPIKFDKDALYRVPALADQIPPPAAASSSVSTTVPQPQPPKGQAPPQALPRAAAPNPQPPRPVAAPSTTTERRVSFAPQQPVKPPPPPPAVKKEEPVAVPIPAAPKPAGDDEYDNYGFSDDDALFSAVDLGDADLGRPIDFEEGLAGGSALEEQEQAEAAAAAASVKAPAAAAVAPAEARYGPMGLCRTGAQPAQQQARSNMGPPALPANSNRPPTAHGQRPNPAGASSTSRPPTVNTAAASVPAPAPAPVAVRHRPPSAGGFHFPPGMEEMLLSQSRNPNQPPPHLNGGGGLKRTADMMNASSTSRPGMGLSVSNGSGGGARQPLGTIALDQSVNVGGDAKRMRR